LTSPFRLHILFRTAMQPWWESSAQFDSLLTAVEAVQMLFWIFTALLLAVAAAAVIVECRACWKGPPALPYYSEFLDYAKPDALRKPERARWLRFGRRAIKVV
jgi:hypothetical protein